MSTHLDPGQVLKGAYDEANEALQVTVVATTASEVATAADGGALPAFTKVASGYDGTNVQVLKTDTDGNLQIDVLSSALPADAATETTLASLEGKDFATEASLATVAGDTTSIDSKLPAQGQALSAASVPVVIASDQSAIPVSASNLDIRDLVHATDSVSIGDGTDLALVTAAGELNVIATAQPGVDIGDVTINNAAGASAVNIQDGGNTITVDGTVAATQSGTWNIANVSGTVSLPTGASTETTLAELNAKTAGSLTPHAYDYISLGYTGDNLTTVTFKSGGAGGSTVDTLTLAYSGSTLTSVTRT